MSTHNISFYEDLTKIIFFQLSSNMHLISSSGEIFKKLSLNYHPMPLLSGPLV